MLLSREEMTFDFGGARFDAAKDRGLLGWMLNQFLYGEVTGIQVGHWLHMAPDLEAARFFARQAIEEFQHVDNFLRIMAMLGIEPGPPHPIVRFLATGMMGGSFAEHVAMEMATGEGFVLMALYGLIDTLDHPQAVEILSRAVRQEERHVEFGEQRTIALLARHPSLRPRLLGAFLIWRWGVGRLARFIQKRLPAQHPVLQKLPAFLQLTLDCADLRVMRIGFLRQPVREMSLATRWFLMAYALASKPFVAISEVFRRKRLTDTYLSDPAVRALPATLVPVDSDGTENAVKRS